MKTISPETVIKEQESAGKWYNSAGVGFAPDEIPSNVADTYYATKALALAAA